MTTTAVKFVTVKEVSETLTDVNGRNYVWVTVSQVEKEEVMPGVFADGKELSTKFKAYEKSYLDDKAQTGWGWKKGEVKLGSIETRKVKSYTIGDRTVDSYSAFVFGDSRKETFEKDVRNIFKSLGHELYEDVKQEVEQDVFDVNGNF